MGNKVGLHGLYTSFKIKGLQIIIEKIMKKF